ncbi:MAG: hypothetical protein IKP60_13840 [Treponema sp.]|nr:hypothetical protein [Treponema sp.]
MEKEKERCAQTGKICYTRAECGCLINDARNHAAFRKQMPKRAYRCQFCGTWHLTHYKIKRKGNRRIKWERK